MAEIGESTELVSELAMESVQDGEPESERARWHMHVAITTLLMALLTAFGALLTGMTAHEALLDRTKEVIEISILEGDRVEVALLKAKHEILISLGETPDEAEIARIREFDEEIQELAAEIQSEERRILSSSSTHLTLAVAVTLLSVGITVGGMSVIVEQRSLWIAGIVFGVAGAVGVAIGVVTMVT